MKSETESLVRVIKKSMEAAGAPMLRDLTELERLQMSGKNASDYARRTQKRCGELLQEELLAARPKFGYRDNVGHKSNGLIETYFLAAPLIGLSNFTRALPMFACSVIVLSKNTEAKAEKKMESDIEGLVTTEKKHDATGGEAVTTEKKHDATGGEAVTTEKKHDAKNNQWRIEAATVYQPLLDDFFVADGKEAFHNQKWLRMTAGHQNPPQRMMHSNQPATGEQNFGTTALELCYLAGNRIDEVRGDKLPLIETAAGIFIAMTAGRNITDKANQPISQNALATMCQQTINDQSGIFSFGAS